MESPLGDFSLSKQPLSDKILSKFFFLKKFNNFKWKLATLSCPPERPLCEQPFALTTLFTVIISEISSNLTIGARCCVDFIHVSRLFSNSGLLQIFTFHLNRSAQPKENPNSACQSAAEMSMLAPISVVNQCTTRFYKILKCRTHTICYTPTGDISR